MKDCTPTNNRDIFKFSVLITKNATKILLFAPIENIISKEQLKKSRMQECQCANFEGSCIAFQKKAQVQALAWYYSKNLKKKAKASKVISFVQACCTQRMRNINL